MTQGARAFIQAVNDFLFLEDAPEQADILFVPGSRWPGNALRAAELYRQGYAPLVLPSGRFAKAGNRFLGPEEPYQAAYPGPFETEWAYLRQVLLEDGVPDSAILREDQATFTWDNARKSRQVTDAAGLDIRRAILCCKGCHARRALLYYQAAFPGTRFLVCPARCPGLNPEDWFLTPLGRKPCWGRCSAWAGKSGKCLPACWKKMRPEKRSSNTCAAFFLCRPSFRRRTFVVY